MLGVGEKTEFDALGVYDFPVLGGQGLAASRIFLHAPAVSLVVLVYLLAHDVHPVKVLVPDIIFEVLGFLEFTPIHLPHLFTTANPVATAPQALCSGNIRSWHM